MLNLGVDITLTSQAKAAKFGGTLITLAARHPADAVPRELADDHLRLRQLPGLLVRPGHAVNSSSRRIAFATEPADRRVCPTAIVALPRFRG